MNAKLNRRKATSKVGAQDLRCLTAFCHSVVLIFVASGNFNFNLQRYDVRSPFPGFDGKANINTEFDYAASFLSISKLA
jgi:hypothetical protein